MLSDFLENELLDHVFGIGAYTVPTNLCIALGTGASDTGLTGEPSGNGYARVVHNTWAAAANRASSNTGQVTFSLASGPWGTMTHFAIFDAATAGNMLIWGALTVSKSVVAGNTPSFATGTLLPTFNTGGISTYLANALLDHILRTTPYSVPANIYLALSTANPGDTGSTIAPPVGNNYARAACNSWNTAVAGATANNGAITFQTPSGSWGLITHAALYDASTAGNMLFYATATPNQTPESGDTVQYADGTFDVTLN